MHAKVVHVIFSSLRNCRRFEVSLFCFYMIKEVIQLNEGTDQTLEINTLMWFENHEHCKLLRNNERAIT